jgi:peptide/nickel transport system permease protein
MQDFILKRVLWMIPALFVMLTLLFFAFQIIPGDPVRAVFSGEGATTLTKEQVEYFRTLFGLDKPLYVRYFKWFWDALHLNLGLSIQTGTEVTKEVAARLTVTTTLVIMALLITVVISIPFGILCAFYQDKWPDYVLRVVALFALSMPSFWVGVLAILILLYAWRWFPPLDYATIFTDPWLTLKQLFLPAFILGVRPVGVAVRVVRSSMLEVFREDFLRTARAKGLIERLVVSRHALPNGMIPVITFFGLEAIILVGSAVLIEQIFAIPGLGTLVVEAVKNRDMYMAQGGMLFLFILSLVVNLIVDILYGVIDPRVRHEYARGK